MPSSTTSLENSETSNFRYVKSITEIAKQNPMLLLQRCLDELQNGDKDLVLRYIHIVFIGVFNQINFMYETYGYNKVTLRKYLVVMNEIYDLIKNDDVILNIYRDYMETVINTVLSWIEKK